MTQKFHKTCPLLLKAATHAVAVPFAKLEVIPYASFTTLEYFGLIFPTFGPLFLFRLPKFLIYFGL
jgi:hypothetical protein